MPLDPSRFTRKTQEALGAAQTRAREAGNTEVSSAHLLRALLDQPEGVVSGVIERIGVDVAALRRRVDEELGRQPRVSGATVRDAQLVHRRVPCARGRRQGARAARRRVPLDRARPARDDQRGGWRRGPPAQRRRHRTTPCSTRCEQVRGSHRVTSDNPEEQYQALEKYGRDLTEAARAGQDRPGHRSRRRDPADHPGAVAPHQEQPGAHR